MLRAQVEGERDGHVLAEMAKARMRTRIPDLVEALTGSFREHHAFVCRIRVERIDQLTDAIVQVSERIEIVCRSRPSRACPAATTRSSSTLSTATAARPNTRSKRARR